MDIKLAWKDWIRGPHFSTLVALPVFAAWGIWLARNKELFDRILILAQIYADHSFGIFKVFSVPISLKPPRIISTAIVDDNFPWAFVDGASQGRPWLGGTGGIIHLSPSRSIHFAIGLGEAYNN